MTTSPEPESVYINLLHFLECSHLETVTVSGVNTDGNFVTTTACAKCGVERLRKIVKKETVENE